MIPFVLPLKELVPDGSSSVQIIPRPIFWSLGCPIWLLCAAYRAGPGGGVFEKKLSSVVFTTRVKEFQLSFEKLPAIRKIGKPRRLVAELEIKLDDPAGP